MAEATQQPPKRWRIQSGSLDVEVEASNVEEALDKGLQLAEDSLAELVSAQDLAQRGKRDSKWYALTETILRKQGRWKMPSQLILGRW